MVFPQVAKDSQTLMLQAAIGNSAFLGFLCQPSLRSVHFVDKLPFFCFATGEGTGRDVAERAKSCGRGCHAASRGRQRGDRATSKRLREGHRAASKIAAGTMSCRGGGRRQRERKGVAGGDGIRRAAVDAAGGIVRRAAYRIVRCASRGAPPPCRTPSNVSSGGARRAPPLLS